MRLFVAIELPDKIQQALVHLERAIPDLRWLPARQLHLTLAFIGEVDESVAGLIEEKLAKISLPAFELAFHGAGCFPDPGRARVLWAGIEKNPALLELAARVKSQLISCGAAIEERPFSPHMTLARLKKPAPDQVTAFLKSFHTFKLPPVPIREFVLFQSKLQQSGAEHIPRRIYPLASHGQKR